MLYRPHLNAQLQARREEFVRFEAAWKESVDEYARRLLRWAVARRRRSG
jgi:hypothetical protein